MIPEDYLDSRTLHHMDNMDSDWTDAAKAASACFLILWLLLAAYGVWLIYQELI